MPMPADGTHQARLLTLRSLLFVPADRADRFEKAVASGADAIILDLEDSVADSQKAAAREHLQRYLQQPCGTTRLVRINPVERQLLREDLECSHGADGLVVPKARGADTIRVVQDAAGGRCPPILPIATETPSAIFCLGSYPEVSSSLCGLTWGAEDLSAAVGAISARDTAGRLTAPYQMARALALFAAHAAGVPAIETVYPAISDATGLATYAQDAARDGFSGMLAIHPSQVPVINQAFTPTDEQLTRAQEIIAAFSAVSGTGVVRLGGQMLDAPHLKQARAIVARRAR